MSVPRQATPRLEPTDASTVSAAVNPNDRNQIGQGYAAEYVRSVCGNGELVKKAREGSPSERAWIFSGVYEIAAQVTFDGLTRGIEHRRGHHNCARGIEHLEPDCLDRFEDDVEAVVDDLLRNGDLPIRNLEGWIRSRLVRATVDGNRRRRGERGALQRPRLPWWLDRAIGDNRWFRVLALDILTWVGVPTTAGAGVWPYAAWADRRAAITGDLGTTEQDVERDVEHVLAIMRRNARWYDLYVERPLGRKVAPLASHDQSPDRESPLALADRHDVRDTLLLNLAAVAIDAMTARIARGEERRSVVVEVISTVFGSGVHQMDQAPGAESVDGDRVSVVLADEQAVEQLVNQISSILGMPDA